MKNENIIEKFEELNSKLKRWLEVDPQADMFDRDGNYIPVEKRKEVRSEA